MRTDIEKEYLLKSIDTSSNTFFIVSEEHKVLAANSYTTGRFGEELIGQLCYRTIYGNSAPCKNCPAVRVIKTGSSKLRYKQDDAEGQQWVSCRFAYPIMEGEKIDGLVLLDFERPASEEVREELRRSNAFFRNLLLSSVDGVIAADIKGKVLIYNEAAAEITGYSVEETLGHKDIRDFYPVEVARDIMLKLRSDDHGGKGKLKLHRFEVQGKSGETIPISLNAAIVYEGDEEVASIGFFHDLREEIRIKSDLEKTQVQLLQAEKMSSLGKLSAGVAHQLNNPLGGITLFTKLLLEEYDLEDAAVDDLNRILLDAQRCRDTVKELLEFARQTSHMVRLQDINQAISRTLFLLENQSLFQNIEIIKELNEAIPDVPVDIQQMNHVLMNIILNAAQAMEGSGKLTITTGEVEDKDMAFIEISDTGPGMTEEILNQVFEPFFTTKEEGKGTGLGLSMVYGIIQDHNGNITAKSGQGEGTTFYIELPLKHENIEGESSGE